MCPAWNHDHVDFGVCVFQPPNPFREDLNKLQGLECSLQKEAEDVHTIIKQLDRINTSRVGRIVNGTNTCGVTGHTAERIYTSRIGCTYWWWWWCWWLFPHLQGFWKNVRPFIPYLYCPFFSSFF